jgi:hypothetical protein
MAGEVSGKSGRTDEAMGGEHGSDLSAAVAVIENNFKWVKESLDEIKGGLSVKCPAHDTELQDHENRIRKIENISTWVKPIAITFIGGCLLFIVKQGYAFFEIVKLSTKGGH